MANIKTDIFLARHSEEIRNVSAEQTDKPCLDEEGGLYRVDGGITIAKIQYRKSNQSNIAPLIGYQVTKGHINEEGKWLPERQCVLLKRKGLS